MHAGKEGRLDSLVVRWGRTNRISWERISGAGGYGAVAIHNNNINAAYSFVHD
jgi:hypothetical protein